MPTLNKAQTEAIIKFTSELEFENHNNSSDHSQCLLTELYQNKVDIDSFSKKYLKTLLSISDNNCGGVYCKSDEKKVTNPM